jgi:hypothetical protein
MPRFEGLKQDVAPEAVLDEIERDQEARGMTASCGQRVKIVEEHRSVLLVRAGPVFR